MVRISKGTALAATCFALAIIPFAWVGLAPAKTTASGSKQAGCGTERWAVKTLADPAGRALSLKPKATTIRKLRRAKAPRNLGVRRTRGIERTTFRVTGRLVEMRLEDDLDINVVIADPTRSGATMIAAFPNPSCTRGAMPKARTKMSRARAAFVAACGAPTTSFQELSGTATITGVGFFDKIHGQEGSAPNGLELHPVVAFSASSCSAAPAPPPPPTGVCAASYPDVCIPLPPPRLTCADIRPYSNFRVLWHVPRPDPQHFDPDHDGIGCES